MEEKQKQISLCDRLSATYPCFVAHNLEAEDDSQVQIFNNLHDVTSSHYSRQIPELQGKRIRGCFHGWMILSNHPHNNIWSLWNPVSCKLIRLPPLILKDGGEPNDIEDCCLSLPADDPNSVLLLTIVDKPNFVFCRLHRNKRKIRWTEMTYGKQLTNLIGEDRLLVCPTCCNGKVYAKSHGNSFLIHVDIVVKDREVVINLSLFPKFPCLNMGGVSGMVSLLKGSSTDQQLFCILIGFKEKGMKTISAVSLLKLDMTSMIWEEMEDLKDHIFTVDIGSNYSVLYYPAIASELGGYIHFLGKEGKVIYSYHVKDKTFSLSSMPYLVRTSYVSEWAMLGCRLEGDDHAVSKEGHEDNNAIIVRSVKDDDVHLNSTMNESHLLNIPFDALEIIMKFCVGFEYLKFRATCKRCHLAASPLIQWRNKTTSNSLVSPWLMVFDKHQGNIIFTDPISGDNYFIKTPQELICNFQIVHSRDGWLLVLKRSGTLVFFNPFTSDIRELPELGLLESYCFSSPPTSPNCMVVGFTTIGFWHIYIHFVSGEPHWRRLGLNFGGADPCCFSFPTFHGPDLFALCNNRELDVFKDIGGEDYSWEIAVKESPTSCCTSLGHHFLVKCDQNLLLVIVGEFGESIEVFKMNNDEGKWEKIDGLGRHVIYICDTTCLCSEAKTPKMMNKIFFPRLHSKYGYIVFYSLDTCSYHTFESENIQENYANFFGTKHHLSPHAWIESSLPMMVA